MIPLLKLTNDNTNQEINRSREYPAGIEMNKDKPGRKKLRSVHMGRKRRKDQEEKKSYHSDPEYKDIEVERKRMINNILGLLVLVLMLVLGFNIGGCGELISHWFYR